MSRISSVGSETLRAVFCLFITFQLISFAAQAADDQQPKKTMPIQVTVSVNWDIESGGSRSEGSMTMRLRGTANLAEEVSVMEPIAQGVMITYGAGGVGGQYTYSETVTQEHPPEGCPELLAEYQANGGFTLEEVTSAMTSGLNIRKVASMIPREMLQFVPAEAKEMMIDYYDFFAVARKQQVQGKKRGWNDCEFVADEKEFNPSGLTIRFQITEDGEMTGQRRWSVGQNAGSPSFSVRVSDLPQKMERRPLVPEPDGGGDVTYAVNWYFGEVDPYVEIQRKEGEFWVPLSGDEPVEVKVGEKIELRGRVRPEEVDSGKGDWTVPGKRVEGFKVEGDTGRKEDLKDKDLEQTPTVSFHWYDGADELKVKYTTKTTEGKSLEAKAAFNVLEPELKIHIDEPSCDFVVADVVWTDDDGIKKTDTELLCDAPGESYSIRFHHDPLPAEFPGQTQYVQTVDTEGLVRRSRDARTQCDMISRQGLDESYPYSMGPEATDRPGVDVGKMLDLTIEVLHRFRMSLMYKPNSEGAIFVPIREAEWWWGGIARRANENTGNWDTSSSEMGSHGSDVQAEDFLEWNQVVRKDDTWQGCE